MDALKPFSYINAVAQKAIAISQGWKNVEIWKADEGYYLRVIDPITEEEYVMDAVEAFLEI
jgi:ssDNA-binding replication factor A large subunit